MSVIKEYLTQLDKSLNDVPFKLLTNVQSENRGDAALYVRGEIIFADKSELHFKEYFIAIPALKRLAYSYHYQTQDKKLIFRYDNAEHYTEMKTYPHHKHIEHEVFPSKNVEMTEVINEIVRSFTK